MSRVTFITGNANKAAFLAQYLGVEIDHKKLDIEEPQSLDLKDVAEQKARRAYEIMQSPVLVEDIGFTIEAMGKLPGPLIKWFIQEIGFDGLCKLATDFGNARAYSTVCYVYYDGEHLEFFEGEQRGKMPEKPRGGNGWGWDCVFIPDGSEKTHAEMSEGDIEKFSLRTTTVYPQLKQFLLALDKN